MNIILVPKPDIDKVVKLIPEFLESAAKYTYGRFDANDIVQESKKLNKQLWVAFDKEIIGFVVTEVVTYPKTKSLSMHFTAGKDLKLWKDPMLSVLRDFAKETQCKRIESFGRRGWEKVFKHDGYKSKFKFYELPLE